VGTDDSAFSKPGLDRTDRLLDRLDRAICKVGRAIWNGLIDGFAAYGMAECVVPLDFQFDPVGDQTQAQPRREAYRPAFRVIATEDLEGEFDNIHDLIRSVEAVGD
jgi:hypothetical protein